MGSFQGHVRITLVSFWDHFGVMLGSLWGHFEVKLGLLWGNFGITAGQFESRIRVPARPDSRDIDFIFFVIGDWEIVIGKKEVKHVFPSPPAQKNNYVDPHPIISRRRPA